MASQSTRLLFAQLPPTLTSPELRQHILQCPPHAPILTDCKVLLRPDGTSRRIAFVGFKDHDEAERVRVWSDGAWVQAARGGGRVKVEWAKDSQDAPGPRKRIKKSPEPAAVPVKAKAPLKTDDERFAEFMSVMGKGKNRALEGLGDNPSPIEEKTKPAAAVVANDKVEEKKKKREKKEKKAAAADSVAPAPVAAEEKAEPVRTDNVANDETISDMEYMARRMRRTLDVPEEAVSEAEELDVETGDKQENGEKEWEQDDEDGNAEAGEGQGADEDDVGQEEDATIRSLRESPRLFIRNLAFTIAEEDLRILLEPFGIVEQIHIPTDPATKSGKGLAFATFSTSEAAIAALEDLDRRSFQGRLLHILPAIARNERQVTTKEGNDKSAVKAERDHQRKQDAGKSINWSTLFMNQDAVLTSVAERLQISKAQLLDPTSSNAAVRVALAETHVIAETKQHFSDAGVNLEALASSQGPKSPTTILVKNLPYGTTRATLQTLFGASGGVNEIVVAPAGTMAIVELVDKDAANDAWRSLVYKKMGGSILYLERAPESIWNPNRPKKVVEKDGVKVPVAADATPVDESAAASTLFVKNLAFSSTTSTLIAAFSHFNGFVFARVRTKPDPKKPGATLSMGFGFVGFDSIEHATTAMSARQGYVLDGHALELKFAQRGKENDKEAEKGGKRKEGKGTKLIVKNVPFEATKKDIRELFSAYGQLNSVRLPRKLDRHTRGFAFLDFISHADATAAFGALEHTHLLGRHLVLQWAEEGVDEVEELRKRTGYSEANVGNKKRKFRMEDDGATAGVVEVMDE